MHYNPNHYLCGRLNGGEDEMSKFINKYLYPSPMAIDGDTHEPFDPITLNMILDDDLLQFFSTQPILDKQHWIRIRPLDLFGYLKAKQIMSMKDIHDGLLECGFKE